LLPATDAVVKEHGRLAAMSAHSSPTKLQPTVAVATVASASSSASSQQQQHLGTSCCHGDDL